MEQTQALRDTFTTATLTNGVRVANFSSPHPFKFTDGTELPACSPERAKSLELNLREVKTPHTSLPISDVSLEPTLTPNVREELIRMTAVPEIDIIVVPLMLLDAVRRAGELNFFFKIRVIRVPDRVSKLVSINEFCV